LLDTPSEDRFDALVKMGARYFDVPCCLISLVDRERIWFKAAVGIEDPEVARTEGLCATTLQGPDLYHLRDASQDEVASKNPLVSPSDGIRFYAGPPLETRDGLNLGSFCVMGHEPRDLSEGDRKYLTEIARLAMYEIERRYAQEELQKLNVELDFRIHTRTKALDSVIQDLEAEVKARVEASEDQREEREIWKKALLDTYAEGRRVQIETQECTESIPVKMSKVDIEEMLINILRNASESGPKSPVQIRLEANEDPAMIEIEDDGCGVPAERRHEVFDPFFTIRLEQGGTGLGLSIADGIVETTRERSNSPLARVRVRE